MTDFSSDHRILIGAGDWRHDGWAGEFYPEDLPEDWRLGYYGNEFPVVAVPPDYALDAAGRSALEEDSDAVRFVVVIDRLETAPARLDAARALGARCAGVLVEGAGLGAAELAELLARCDSLPVAVCGVDALPDETPPQASLCWDGAGSPPASNGLKLARLATAEAAPRRLREIMEGLLADDSGQAVLLFQGDPPDVAVMRNAVVIRDLL